MFYCVTSIYRAGGNITRDVYAVYANVKPTDSETELTYHIVVNKYFDTEEQANVYIKSIEK